MKARIDYFCQPTPTSSGEIYNIYMFVDLPFVPAVGTLLKLTREGDYLKVADVTLDVSPGGQGLLIGLEEPEEDSELRPWAEMQAQGWMAG